MTTTNLLNSAHNSTLTTENSTRTASKRSRPARKSNYLEKLRILTKSKIIDKKINNERQERVIDTARKRIKTTTRMTTTWNQDHTANKVARIVVKIKNMVTMVSMRKLAA